MGVLQEIWKVRGSSQMEGGLGGRVHPEAGAHHTSMLWGMLGRPVWLERRRRGRERDLG